MDYILSFFISVSQQVHANILVSSLPTCPGKKKNPSETRVSYTRVPLLWTLKKQSILSAWFACTSRGKKIFPMELEFHWCECSKNRASNLPKTEHLQAGKKKISQWNSCFIDLSSTSSFKHSSSSHIYIFKSHSFFIFFIFLHISFFLEDLKFQTLEFFSCIFFFLNLALFFF